MANENVSEFAVLLEVGKSRRQVTVTRNSIFEQLQQELRKLVPQISLLQRDDTGSSVCSVQRITIIFNSLSGLARRPISHTCSNTLELSTTYCTFPEFAAEFQAILTDPIVTWYMDGL